ncbi:uncharacterized protein LOC128676966 [Plodia interpunctella]|uniref:uncharacterized protein LOC128676966 n=1 Tax=Plodia interpunctella TaxID=58824 RepID=UPI0023676D9D|nr:uncharacterized protein LOC128676966 [Plodia interpunctella]
MRDVASLHCLHLSMRRRTHATITASETGCKLFTSDLCQGSDNLLKEGRESVAVGASRCNGMRRLWPAAVAVCLLPAVCGDVIFRVPEVMVQHAAAPKPVGTGRINASKSNDFEWSPDEALVEVRYEEYFVEHDVSTVDARRSARALHVEDVPETQLGCGSCSRREMEYCETRVLADHCCCDRQVLPEPFPWLPHTCYMGPHRCRPLAHDCAQYERLRDCCCARKLAERWKSILSKSTRVGVSGASLLLLSMLLFVAYL